MTVAQYSDKVFIHCQQSLHSFKSLTYSQTTFTFFAALKLGTTFFSLDSRLSGDTVVHLLKETSSSFLVTSKENRKRAKRCVTTLQQQCGDNSNPNDDFEIWDDFDVEDLIHVINYVSHPCSGNASPISYNKQLRQKNSLQTTLFLTPVLVELDVDKAISYFPTEMITKIHGAVGCVNKCAKHYEAIAIPGMIYILPLNKKLLRIIEGAVSLKKVMTLFNQGIQQLYDAKFPHSCSI
ncbi:hypothetical protein BDA99DRAFT_541714 [Phascolomyces articulosus]|uniref:Uncharacterized protein n=1 Tax=Phascolomyces articulosus TaxID=60185 RepID=A0AAD5P9H5_9FUNG|nr:hypothetical protein BDA99DRAFT_541714 [Phascolomyces articulosus]